jgi:hypothetical protein
LSGRRRIKPLLDALLLGLIRMAWFSIRWTRSGGRSWLTVVTGEVGVIQSWAVGRGRAVGRAVGRVVGWVIGLPRGGLGVDLQA